MAEQSLQQAKALSRAGRVPEAVEICRRILAAEPRQLETLVFLASLDMQLGRFEAAEQNFANAQAIDPSSIVAASGRAAALQAMARHAEAVAVLDSLLQQNATHAMTWYNRGNLLHQSGRSHEAAESYGRALELEPRHAEAWHNRGLARTVTGDLPGGLEDFTRALELKPRFADALVNRGFLMNRMARHADAVEDFERAVLLQPDDAGAWLGRGIALSRLNHNDEALTSFSRALALRPGDPLTLYNRAAVLSGKKRYGEAVTDLEQLVAAAPEFPLAAGLLLSAKLHACDWRGLDNQISQISSALGRGRRVIDPFVHLGISELPAEQFACARLQAFQDWPAVSEPLYRGERFRHERIRIAYLSSVFFEHAVPFLIAGVLEQHDRGKFETYGVSFGPNDHSGMRARLERALTHFFDVGDQPDAAIANLLRRNEIDIVIDLNGYTGGARPGILAYRPAPVQVNYLGYPGTMGANYIDYIIADRLLIPPEHRQFYSEQVVWLPDAYQANDDSRPVPAPPSRAEAGLPESDFVFCCFNGNHKILPETFARWMAILRDTGNSVLWLLEGSPRATANLRNAARSHGITPERLIFAPHERPDRHLARLQLADLVLDTLPYGAHTTASDALWAGVPVLTLFGQSFAGRVAASLLSAVGMQELITHSAEQFHRLACELTRDPERLTEVKRKLARNRCTMPLFDTVRMTRNLEAVYTAMWERHQRGEPPAHFAV